MVPSQKGTFLEAQVETSRSSQLLFEPNWGCMALMGVEVEDSVTSLILKIEFGYLLATTLLGQLSCNQVFPLGVWWHRQREIKSYEFF